MLKDLFDALLPGFELAFTAFMTAASAYAVAWIRAHTKNATAAGLEEKLVNATGIVVREAEQTTVAATKKGLADGTLSREDAVAIRDEVIAKLKTMLGPAGLADLAKKVGSEKVDEVLVSRVEATAHQVKQEAAVAPAVAAAVAAASVRPPPPVAP
jgi:hypothetical protein